MTNPPGDHDSEHEDPHRPQQQPPGGPQPPGWGPPSGHPEQQGYPPAGFPPPGYPPQYPYRGPGQYFPDHPKATTSLVLGILSIVLCQVLGPFAWAMGRRTVEEIDASYGRYAGRGAAQAGYVLGVVGTILLGLVVLYVAFLIVMIAVAGTATIGMAGIATK